MKKNFLLLIIPVLISACQPKANTATTATPGYPYTIKHPDYWDMDTSHTNTMTALNALKAYEKMDTALMKKCFADSIYFKYDKGVFKGTKAEFIKMALQMDGMMKNNTIDMKDWESVISKDKKEEWVTLWYTQKWTDAKGVADSAEFVNDMGFKNGKIFRLDEYTRNFEKKK